MAFQSGDRLEDQTLGLPPDRIGTDGKLARFPKNDDQQSLVLSHSFKT